MKMDRTHQRAAALLGQGHSRAEVAAEVGVSEASVSRWRSNPDFEAAVDAARRAHLDANPTAAATLEAALAAVKKDGTPDWTTRVQAARALLGTKAGGGSPEDEVRETRIFINGGSGDA